MKKTTAPDTTLDLEEVLAEESLDTQSVAEIKQKSVSGAVSCMVRTVFLQILSLVTVGILAAYLGAPEYGIFGLVTQIVGLLTFFSDIGLASALIQKKTEPSTVELRTVFTVQLALSCLIFLVTLGIVASQIMHSKLGTPGELVLLALGGSFILVTFKTIPSILLERKLDFAKLVVPQVGEQIVYNLVLIVLVTRGVGVMAYFYAVLGRTILGVIIMAVTQRWSIGLALDKPALKALLQTGVKFQLYDLIARLKDQLYYLALGIYFPAATFGYINFGKNFSQLPYNLTVQNVVAITFPTYARLQHNPALLKKAIEKTLFFISLSIFPLLAGMVTFIIPLTQVIPAYAKWQPAIPSFIFFTLSIGWAAVSTPLTNTLNAIGQVGASLKLMIMWTVLTWILTPLLVIFYDFNGVALAAFVISITSLIPVYLVKKVVKLEIWDQIWRQLVAAGAMMAFALTGIGWWSRGVPWLILGLTLAGGVYIGVLVLIGGSKLKAEVLSLRSKG